MIKSPERILFWREKTGNAVVDSMLGVFLIGDSPEDFKRADISTVSRRELGRILAAGRRGESYLGHANCRICGIKLGSADMTGHGFIWPEKAEHYVLNHNVWTPGCTRLLVAVRSVR